MRLSLFVAALLLAACGGAGAPGSGIRGTILAGPTCPVQRIDSPCADRPISLTIEVVSGSTVAATVTSDSAGTFSIAVAPGTYTLRSKSGLPFLRATTVQVLSGEFTDLELHADTGIR